MKISKLTLRAERSCKERQHLSGNTDGACMWNDVLLDLQHLAFDCPEAPQTALPLTSYACLGNTSGGTTTAATTSTAGATASLSRSSLKIHDFDRYKSFCSTTTGERRQTLSESVTESTPNRCVFEQGAKSTFSEAEQEGDSGCLKDDKEEVNRVKMRLRLLAREGAVQTVRKYTPYVREIMRSGVQGQGPHSLHSLVQILLIISLRLKLLVQSIEASRTISLCHTSCLTSVLHLLPHLTSVSQLLLHLLGVGHDIRRLDSRCSTYWLPQKRRCLSSSRRVVPLTAP
jgi:hypothetical protein